MGFSPNDGYLYIASGDGGGGNDQHGAIGNGQNINTLLGKMLRIDVNSDGFPGDANRNYANPATNPFAGATAGSTPPIAEYTHQDGISVTGGYVYRGSAIPGLQGTYFYGDYGSAKMWSFRYDGANRTAFTERTGELRPSGGLAIDSISSFGEDAAGNMYIVDYAGEVFRIVRSPKVEFVASGDQWKFLANGSNQGEAWQDLGFNDASWSTGRSQLGYGDGAEVTVVPCGPSAPACNASNHITTYFRKTFNVADPSLVTALEIDLLRDDAAAVYINGTEVARTTNLQVQPFPSLAGDAGRAARAGRKRDCRRGPSAERLQQRHELRPGTAGDVYDDRRRRGLRRRR
jgi:hypothetical protein